MIQPDIVKSSFEPIPAMGVYPPEPTPNIEKPPFYDQSVFVPIDRAFRQIPIDLTFGGGVNIRRDPPFFSEQSNQAEVPFIVTGTDPKAVAERVRAVFQLPE